MFCTGLPRKYETLFLFHPILSKIINLVHPYSSTCSPREQCKYNYVR